MYELNNEEKKEFTAALESVAWFHKKDGGRMEYYFKFHNPFLSPQEFINFIADAYRETLLKNDNIVRYDDDAFLSLGIDKDKVNGYEGAGIYEWIGGEIYGVDDDGEEDEYNIIGGEVNLYILDGDNCGLSYSYDTHNWEAMAMNPEAQKIINKYLKICGFSYEIDTPENWEDYTENQDI